MPSILDGMGVALADQAGWKTDADRLLDALYRLHQEGWREMRQPDGDTGGKCA